MSFTKLRQAAHASVGASIVRLMSWRSRLIFVVALTIALAGGRWIAEAAQSVNVGDPATVDGRNGTVVSVFGAERFAVVDLAATATPTPTPTPTATPTSSTCMSVASLSAAQSAIASGHNACLADGNYSGNLTLRAPSGWSSSRLTLSAQHPLAAHITGLVTLNSHTAVSGLDLTASGDCVAIPVASTTIAVLNSRIHDCGRDGIRWARPALDGSNETKNVLLQGNEIANVRWNSLTIRGNTNTILDNNLHGSTNDAINAFGDSNHFIHNHIHGYSGTVGTQHCDTCHPDGLQTWGNFDDGFHGTALTHLLFERNTLESITGPNSHGIMMKDWGSGTIRRNLFRNISSYAANLYGGQNIAMVSNTFVNTGIVEYGNASGGTSNGTLMANIFGPGVAHPYIKGTVSHDYNLAADWTPSEPHGIHADPQFDSTTDQHLQATSPARDTGDPNISATDLDGINPVNTPDRGAYEYH
jgi:Right handed beta helix region